MLYEQIHRDGVGGASRDNNICFLFGWHYKLVESGLYEFFVLKEYAVQISSSLGDIAANYQLLGEGGKEDR